MPKNQWIRWLELSIPLTGVVVIAFILGAMAVHYEWEAGSWVRDALNAKSALEKEQQEENEAEAEFKLGDKDFRRVILQEAKANASAGYTLLTNEVETAAELIDMQGNVAHRWALPFSSIWPDYESRNRKINDNRVYWHRAVLTPDGGVMAVYTGGGVTPYGRALAKLNADSSLAWAYRANVHHDVTVGTDGTIYTLTQEIRKTPLEEFPQLTPPILDDFLVMLSPDGVEQKKIHVLTAFARSPYKQMIRKVKTGSLTGDYLHNNTARVIENAENVKIPGVKNGDVFMSMRHQNLIFIINPETETVVWAARGPWRLQHDPQFLSNGNILLFDNQGDFNGQIFWDSTPNQNQEKPKRSRLLEYDPVAKKIVWQFAGTREFPLYSFDRGMVEVLPNGNYLITEARKARVLEITPQKEVVWAYEQQLFRGEKRRPLSVLSAIRYAPEDVTFLKDPEASPASSGESEAR